MMPIPITCGACGRKLKVKDELAGKRVRCPDCRETVAVPKPQEDDDTFLDDLAQASESGEEMDEMELPARAPLRRSKAPARKSRSGSGFPVKWVVVGVVAAVGVAALIGVGLVGAAVVKSVTARRELVTFFNAAFASQRKAAGEYNRVSGLLSQCMQNDCSDYSQIQQGLRDVETTRLQVMAELDALAIPSRGNMTRETVGAIREWVKTEDEVVKSLIPAVIEIMQDRSRSLQERGLSVVAIAEKAKVTEDASNLRMVEAQQAFFNANGISIPPQIAADLAKARAAIGQPILPPGAQQAMAGGGMPRGAGMPGGGPGNMPGGPGMTPPGGGMPAGGPGNMPGGPGMAPPGGGMPPGAGPGNMPGGRGGMPPGGNMPGGPGMAPPGGGMPPGAGPGNMPGGRGGMPPGANPPGGRPR
jgi:hypothetical protein